MRFIRMVAKPFAPRDARLQRVLAALHAQLGTPIAFEQGVFMTKPLPDTAARIDEWLHPAGKLRVRGQVLSNGRPADEIALFTVLNRTDRRETPGVPISEITLSIGDALLATDRIEALIEAIATACDAFHAHGFHGPDQQALGMLLLEARQRPDAYRALPFQTDTGQRLHGTIGWIGFVNDATADALGFPARGHAFGEARPAREGTGWMYRLTPDPLDMANPAHRDQVDAALGAGA